MPVLFVLVCVLVGSLFAAATSVADEPRRVSLTSADWPNWRGPRHDGTADPQQTLPLQWSETENVLWKTPIPGRGHSSPIVVGNMLYLTTADEAAETRSVLAYSRTSGAPVWSTVVHAGAAMPQKNEKASQASSTLACDGERLFANFLNDGGMYTTALTLDGKILWQTRVTDYIVHQGYGSSPVVYENLCIVAADNKAGGAVAGLDRATGKIVWKVDRPETPNYPSPVIVNASGAKQLIMIGCDLVTSLDPRTGKKRWEFPGATTECVTSTVTNGELIYSTGGYPRNHVTAIRADGSGEVVWEDSIRVYVPSLLLHKAALYTVQDGGIAVCWNAATGKEHWKGRLQGAFTASPVLVGDTIYATSEQGETFLFNASPDEFEVIGRNTIAGECYATPTICGERIFLRVGVRADDQRQEYLYCVGQK